MANGWVRVSMTSSPGDNRDVLSSAGALNYSWGRSMRPRPLRLHIWKQRTTGRGHTALWDTEPPPTSESEPPDQTSGLWSWGTSCRSSPSSLSGFLLFMIFSLFSLEASHSERSRVLRRKPHQRAAAASPPASTLRPEVPWRQMWDNSCRWRWWAAG